MCQRLAGDFNSDGNFDCADVDTLVAEIAAGTNNGGFDLTGDGAVNVDDLNEWLAIAGAANLASGNPYLPGDANLDGVVDTSDFGIWNSHKFTTVAAWCSGDFNADGAVDVSDFNIWTANRFTAADSLAAVPEPTTPLWLSIGLGLAISLSRRRWAMGVAAPALGSVFDAQHSVAPQFIR